MKRQNIVALAGLFVAILGAVFYFWIEYRLVSYILYFYILPFLFFGTLPFSELKKIKFGRDVFATAAIAVFFLSIDIFFRMGHYPGAFFARATGFLVSMVSLVLAILAIIRNKQNSLAANFTLFYFALIPFLIVTMKYIPSYTNTETPIKMEVGTSSKKESVEEMLVNIFLLQAKTDSMSISGINDDTLNTHLEQIRDWKKRMIAETGGIDEETGIPYGAMNRNTHRLIYINLKDRAEDLYKQYQTDFDKIEQCTFTIEALIILGEIEDQIILKAINEGSLSR